MLHAVGAHGCRSDDLATRLGLSRELAPAVAEAAGALITKDLLAEEGGRISLTDAGSAWMVARLAELGVV
jgi:predicted transcriptional regulator